MDCCTAKPATAVSPAPCPECGKPGRLVDRITVKAMLRPGALMRLSAPEHRFCATPECPVVYFGIEEAFDREELVVPVFQKEPAGDRRVCYCFGIGEGDLRLELVETGRSTASARVSALVKADRCACEVKNPQGSCCLGNLAAAAKAVKAALDAGAKAAAYGSDACCQLTDPNTPPATSTPRASSSRLAARCEGDDRHTAETHRHPDQIPPVRPYAIDQP